jgi:hypothetical protein
MSSILTNIAHVYEPKCGGMRVAESHLANEYSCAHGAQINVLHMLLYSVYVYWCTQLTWRYLCCDGRWLLCGGCLWVRPGGFGLTAVVVHPGNVVHGYKAVHTHTPPRVHKYLGITNNGKDHGPNLYNDTKP